MYDLINVMAYMKHPNFACLFDAKVGVFPLLLLLDMNENPLWLWLDYCFVAQKNGWYQLCVIAT
jgi:hypothetical protein